MPDTGRTGAWIEWELGAPVTLEHTCSIGRADTNEVVLPSESVSRRHAVINAEGHGTFHILDLGSSNGTFVNGRRITRSTLLRDGDSVEIGPFQFRFRQRGAHDPNRAAAATPPDNPVQTVRVVKGSEYWLLLADLASSTALNLRVKPEELPTITGEWFEQCRDVIERNGGAIDTCLGDGFLAYWHARTPAADQVTATLAQLKLLRDVTLPFRLAVHYGEVFVNGNMASGVERFFGPQVNFVYKLERLASTLGASVLLSPAARDLLKDKLDILPLGEHEIPGFPGKFQFYSF